MKQDDSNSRQEKYKVRLAERLLSLEILGRNAEMGAEYTRKIIGV